MKNYIEQFKKDNDLSARDIFFTKNGFCYRTEEEAEANIDKFKAYIADVVEGCNG